MKKNSHEKATEKVEGALHFVDDKKCIHKTLFVKKLEYRMSQKKNSGK